jgi:hypothetical protein
MGVRILASGMSQALSVPESLGDLEGHLQGHPSGPTQQRKMVDDDQ